MHYTKSTLVQKKLLVEAIQIFLFKGLAILTCSNKSLPKVWLETKTKNVLLWVLVICVGSNYCRFGVAKFNETWLKWEELKCVQVGNG